MSGGIPTIVKVTKYTGVPHQIVIHQKLALGVKSRIDFFLISKELEMYVKTVDMQASVAPDHKTIYMSLHLPKITTRGAWVWEI